MLKIGCCGFPVSKERYFEKFSVVEIQCTFYNIPRNETLERWRKESPEGFEFTLKAWQVITHPCSSPTYRRMRDKFGKETNYGFFQSTAEVKEAMEKTLEAGKLLNASLIIFQTPPSFHYTEENMQNLYNFFSQFKKDNLRFAIEWRGKWDTEKKREICKSLNLIQSVDPFRESPLYGDFQYFRLHGIGGYSYRFHKDDLEKLLEKCRVKDTYCFFNNLSMWEDAIKFSEMAIRYG